VIARGCGEATDVAGVLAGSLRAALAAVPGGHQQRGRGGGHDEQQGRSGRG
jgi:hypothetical protein